VRTVAIAACVGALASGRPIVAAAVVNYARNADKVDGKYAVGASASSRAGKLVATNKNGLLPNNIIAQAPDSAGLDARCQDCRRQPGWNRSGEWNGVAAGGRFDRGGKRGLSRPPRARGLRRGFVSPRAADGIQLKGVGPRGDDGEARRLLMDNSLAEAGCSPDSIGIEFGVGGGGNLIAQRSEPAPGAGTSAVRNIGGVSRTVRILNSGSTRTAARRLKILLRRRPWLAGASSTAPFPDSQPARRRGMRASRHSHRTAASRLAAQRPQAFQRKPTSLSCGGRGLVGSPGAGFALYGAGATSFGESG
jgi:hypothetical protein